MMISQEQASKPVHPSAQISHDGLLSYSFQRLALSKSFHVQSINPRSLIGPILESFLQNVNSIYYLISPDDLWSYLDSVLAPISVTPNLTMSVVCICIAIGYQTRPTGAPDIAIMWYENGRRYLDDCDWNLDPTVMQILALISMFHMAERPATSSHYLGTNCPEFLTLGLTFADAAMGIAVANNLHRSMEEVNQTGGSWNIEWLDIWNTMVDMNR
jgi:hypothetical protein